MAERSKIVDFQRFRKAREQARLPLFDDAPPAVQSLVAIPAARPLTPEEVAHRERMLRHLRESRG
jgi:hypothetical protein